MTARNVVTVEAPAKINLGLEILGKRPDGFHEIRSVMTMLHLSDTLQVYAGGPLTSTELPNIPADTNLIAKALDMYRRAVPGSPELGWSITKRIPVAAGLGSASSNAAAALLAANALSGNPMSRNALADLAATLGSDVPFFLGTSAAFASGRGTDLAPLSPIDEPVTLLLPRSSITDKTRTLYSLIVPGDLSDGSRSERVHQAMERRVIPASTDLANAFSRPLSSLVPDVGTLMEAFSQSGAGRFGLSGAGPAHYVIGRDACEALSAYRLENHQLDLFETIETRTRLTPLVVQPSACDA